MITDIGFRTPRDFEGGEFKIGNVLVIGSCLVAAIPEAIPTLWPGAQADWIALNNIATLPESPPRSLQEYDFQLIQIATRSILRERDYMGLRYHQAEEWKQVFEATCQRLELLVSQLMRYNRESGLLTFVSNFFVPQQNPHGRLLPRNDLRDMTCFFRELNRRLEDMVRAHANAYVLDVDEIAASIGKRYILDDSMWCISHNSVYGGIDEALDRQRLQPPAPLSSKFQLKAWEFVLECLNELRAGLRTARGADAIKLVVTDLDDTLWRGVSGEWDGPRYSEGWPMGYAEALAFLSQRGVLLGVISKNDEATALRNWSSQIPPSAFTVLKINWEDKATNMAQVLATVNLLPHNVLFIDDNPVERDNMRRAFPTLRVAGDDPHLLRRMLLWSPELQSSQITSESAHRKEALEGQLEREKARHVLSREEFLDGLGLKLKAISVSDSAHGAFERCLELVNKTNQFNTTGERWTREGLMAAMAQETTLLAFECADNYTQYGITSVVLLRAGVVQQMVLSCRVFGLHIEEAIVQSVTGRPDWGGGPIRIRFCDTGKNKVALQNLSAIGMRQSEHELVAALGAVHPWPAHVTLL